MEIPARKDWGNYKEDFDVRYAYKLYGGKSIDDSMEYFVTSPIERASELRFAPFKIYQYYVNCFIRYLTSEKASEESDMASVFLGLARDMSEKYPVEFSEFYLKIQGAINYVVENQEYYDADYDIYGSFRDVRSEILQNLETNNGRNA